VQLKLAPVRVGEFPKRLAVAIGGARHQSLAHHKILACRLPSAGITSNDPARRAKGSADPFECGLVSQRSTTDRGELNEMTEHRTGTQEEHLAARLQLLEAEKELTRRSDELARRRSRAAVGPRRQGVRVRHHGERRRSANCLPVARMKRRWSS
jgi:hypothetical protein